MPFKIFGGASAGVGAARAGLIALALRCGLGSVFVIGGWWKLSRAIDPDRAGALVSRYVAGDGYINAFFEQYLFAGPVGGVLTPLVFLTLLSAFELFAGVALIAGLFVRASSFIFAFLLWTFVIALPVVTAQGFGADAPSHFSPALLVQIRDVGLSGMCFVLFALGSGAYSLDRSWLDRGAAPETVDWNGYGLLLRLSVAAVFLVGGFFAGYGHIKTFLPVPALLILIGAILASGYFTRLAAAAGFAVIAWYMIGALNPDQTLWGNLNAVKREVAYLAATGVLAAFGGGAAYRPGDLLRAPLSALAGRPQAAS